MPGRRPVGGCLRGKRRVVVHQRFDRLRRALGMRVLGANNASDQAIHRGGPDVPWPICAGWLVPLSRPLDGRIQSEGFNRDALGGVPTSAEKRGPVHFLTVAAHQECSWVCPRRGIPTVCHRRNGFIQKPLDGSNRQE